MELTRAIIHSFAVHCSKLKPEITGAAYKNLEKVLQFKPNPWMITTQFIYRIATILSVENNAFIVPIEDEYGYICGYYPVLPQSCEVLDVSGVTYLRYTFANGKKAAIEYNKVGILTQFQYRDDIFGSDNSALKPTMQLIHTHNQGIINGVKNSAMIRFLAKIANVLKPEDITKERERFTKDNLSADNKSGMIIYDGKFSDIKQVISKPFIIDPAQVKQIQENAFRYFGTNEKILTNSFTEDDWNAYFEGKIEPFAVQLSLAMSIMTFTTRELAFDNKILFTTNRLQYASNKTKLFISTQLIDRGILSRNEVREIWNRPPIEGGDLYFIRKEYGTVGQVSEGATDGEEPQGEGDNNGNK
jgi:HK97 family phage portal protein